MAEARQPRHRIQELLVSLRALHPGRNSIESADIEWMKKLAKDPNTVENIVAESSSLRVAEQLMSKLWEDTLLHELTVSEVRGTATDSSKCFVIAGIDKRCTNDGQSPPSSTFLAAPKSA